MTTTLPHRAGGTPTGRLPDLVGWVAALWAAAYGALALIWTATGRGYPFGGTDAVPLLDAAGPRRGSPLVAAAMLTTAVVAAAMAGPHAARVRGPARAVLLGYGWTVTAALLVLIPGTTVLALTGYLPMLVLGAPFGWPPVDWAQVLTWSLLNRTLCMLGGVLVAATVLTWQRRTRPACVSCGRDLGDGPDRGEARRRAARWARAALWAVAVAVVVPLAYATTRYAWLLGIPLGMDAASVRSFRASGAVWAGAGLATFAVVGAVLTLGLVQRWGEVFPRWMLGLAGRRVPVKLAVVPATYVALAVTSGGLGLLGNPAFGRMAREHSMSIVLYLLWPVWGVALGVATYAYHLRRRGRCRSCGKQR